MQLLCDHATLVAPALVAALDGAGTRRMLQRAIARVLGFAGHGYEVPLGKLLDSGDEQTVREALRSLARIGTPRAAALVGAQVGAEPRLDRQRRRRNPVALSPDRVGPSDSRAARTARVRPAPSAGRRTAARPRGAERRARTSDPILQTLVPLRYRFWNPALVRVARQARTMLTPMTTSPPTRPARVAKRPTPPMPHRVDPVALLKGLVSLRRLTGLYPAGHPAIEQKLAELDDSVQRHIRAAAALRIDVIHGSAHLDGVPFRQDSEAQSQILRELTDLGIDSIHFGAGRHAAGAAGALGVPLAAQGSADRRADRRAARGAADSAHQPRPAGAARHALEDRAVARRAERARSIRRTSSRSR